MPVDKLTIPLPDDWHLHLRDDALLAAVLPATVRDFGRAIVMPNLKPPVTTAAAAAAYRDRIRALLPQTTIVLLTANVQAASKARAEALGVHFLAKPITEAVVRQALSLWEAGHG